MILTKKYFFKNIYELKNKTNIREARFLENFRAETQQTKEKLHPLMFLIEDNSVLFYVGIFYFDGNFHLFNFETGV